MGIVLRGPGIYVPETVLTNQDLEKLVDTSDEWIIQRTGIQERRIEFERSVPEMAIESVKDLQDFLGRDLKPDEVRVTTNKHKFGEFPCYASEVAGFLGVGNVALQDGLAGCTGLVYAIRDSSNAIASGEIDSALVIGSERLSDFTDYGHRDTCVLFGDGAGAYFLERDDSKEGIIANFLGGTPDKDGTLATERRVGKKLFVEDGRFVTRDVEDDYLIMDGQEVFKFATSVMREAIHGVLHRSSYELGDVDVIIPHGANLRIIDAANKKLRRKGFKGEIYTNLQRFGNTSTASIPLAAREAVDMGVIKPGSLVVNVAFGAGFTYGANLYRAA